MHMEALRGAGMPPFIPPAPVLMPVPEPSLAAMLIHQIEYYFRCFDITCFLFIIDFLLVNISNQVQLLLIC